MSRMRSSKFWITAVLLGAALPLAAADLPRVRPEIVGLSTERLARIGTVMQKYVDDGRLGGVVTLVARNGKVAGSQRNAKGPTYRVSPARCPATRTVAMASRVSGWAISQRVPAQARTVQGQGVGTRA